MFDDIIKRKEKLIKFDAVIIYIPYIPLSISEYCEEDEMWINWNDTMEESQRFNEKM